MVPEGIDGHGVGDWLISNVSGTAPPFEYELIAGGRSNLTFAVTDAAGRRLVLRRPPMSHVLASAHDMGREHTIISALHDTPVPVPTALGFCGDASVNDAPFYVMEFVEGEILRAPPAAAAMFDEAARRSIGEDLVDVLVAIHAVDVDAVGLGDLGRRSGYVDRQLARWHGQYEKSRAQEVAAGIPQPDSLIDEVHELLADRVPPQRDSTIAHGDYRLDNTIIGRDARVRAVLDWELCTLGDPLADLGTFLMYWTDRDDEPAATGLAVTTLPGFPVRTELAERYATRSGRDLSALPYYLAFAHWRLACILEGVYARYATGAMGTADPGAVAAFARAVERAAQQANDALEAHDAR